MAIASPIGPASHPGPASLQEVRWRWRDVAIVFAPVALQTASAWLPDRILAGLMPPPRWLGLSAYLGTYLWMAAYPLWIASRQGYQSPRLSGGRRALADAGIAIGYVGFSIAVTQVIVLLAGVALGESARPGPTHEAGFRSSPLDTLVLTTVAVTLGPIAEELAFRGVLLNVLGGRLPLLVAAVLQGLAFGIYHPFAPVNQAAIAVMGCALGLIYRWRGTLLTPVLCHALMNGFGSAVMIYLAWGYSDGPVLGVRGSAEPGRCRVVEVVTGSAAEAAGLRAGDAITAIDGVPIADPRRLVEVIATRKVGDPIRVEFVRDGESREILAVLQRRGDR